MCGIVGYIGHRPAAPLLHRSLKRLEYRGYDSAGLSTVSDGRIFTKKDQGRVDEIHARLNLDDLAGSAGIGHTRWATHGAPLRINAHPHLDCTEKIAAVHNGILENFLQLRRELTDLKHAFASKTDTEVVPHLVEEGIKRGLPFFSAALEALRRLHGSYALTMLYAGEPDKVVCAKNECPLVIGIREGAMFAASDATAFIEHTDKAICLDNGEAAVMTKDGYEIYKIDDGSPISREPVTLSWTVEMAEKQGYSHFTLKEIYEQPHTIREVLRINEVYADLLVEFLDRGRDAFLIGAGTSYHACLAAAHMFSKLARLTAYPVVASEFAENYGSSVGIDTVVLAVSQSGETADVLEAVELARLKATTILGLTNVVGSMLTRVSRAYILQNSGPEIGVAATKTFTAQVTALAQLALRLARRRGKMAQYEMDETRERLYKMPKMVREVLESCHGKVKEVAAKCARENCILFLGRGISTAIALEGRLKVMELSSIPCVAYAAGESKHGPISIVKEGFPTLFVAPKDETRRTVVGNIMEMKARGARIISIAQRDDKEIEELSDDFIPMPMVPSVLTPIPYAIPLQLLAYHMALERNLDPDHPRGLAKAVTVK